MSLIVIDGALRYTTDGRLVTDAGGAPCCCGGTGFYFRARRCDMVHPPSRPDIPPEVPLEIVFQRGFRCDNGLEPCEIWAGRIVLYGGYCYEVESTNPPEPMPEPCEAHTQAQFYRLEDFPNPPHIANWADITCKPEDADCDDFPCLPEGECCAPALQCGIAPGPMEPTACRPCPCPAFARWMVRVSWSNVATSSEVYPDRTEGSVARTRGAIDTICECNPDVPNSIRVVSFSGFIERSASRTEFSNYPPANGTDWAYNGPAPYSILRLFGESGGRMVGEGDAPPGVLGTTLQNQPWRYVLSSAFTACGFSDVYSDEFGEKRESATASANCYGGSASYVGILNFTAPDGSGIIRHRWNASAAWSFVPLLACPGSDGLFAGSPRPVLPTGAIPLTFAAIKRIIFGGKA